MKFGYKPWMGPWIVGWVMVIAGIMYYETLLYSMAGLFVWAIVLSIRDFFIKK